MPPVHVHSVSFSSLSRRLFEAHGLGSYVFPLPGGAVSHTTQLPGSLNRLIMSSRVWRRHGPRRTNTALKIEA